MYIIIITVKSTTTYKYSWANTNYGHRDKLKSV